MFKKYIVLLVIIVGAFVFYRASKHERPVSVSNNNELKIGLFGPLSGANAASTGAAVFESFRLAHEQMPRVNGRPVTVVYEDDGCDPKRTVSAVQKLLSVDQVDILVAGVCSGPALAAAPIAEQAKVVMVAPIAASPKLTDAGDYIFRLSAASTKAALAASELFKKRGYGNVAILYEAVDYTIGWRDAFMAAFGKQAVASEGFASTDTDVRSQWLKIHAQKPEAVLLLVSSPSAAAVALKQYHELGLSEPLVGNESLSLNAVRKLPDADGVFVVLYKYDTQSALMQKLLTAFESRYHHALPEEIYGALAYDTYQVLMQALKDCPEAVSECLKANLYKVTDFAGASGIITIDEHGDTAREFVLKQIKNGELVGVAQ